MSYILVKFDDDQTFFKSRNSGMIVSTGTGSTSWTYNVNKLTNQSVESILRIIFESTGQQINFKGKIRKYGLIPTLKCPPPSILITKANPVVL